MYGINKYFIKLWSWGFSWWIDLYSYRCCDTLFYSKVVKTEKMMNKYKSIWMVYLLTLLLSGCSSTTMIQTNPSKAKLYIDGAYVGVTPYLYSDTKIVGSSMVIKLEMEGFKPLVSTITRDEEVDVGAVIGGVFFTIPFLWTMKYSPMHNYELIPMQDKHATDSQNNQNSNKSKADKLRDLKNLLDDNIITKDEFEKGKSKILDADD